MEKYYYHITPIENIESILKNGLRANEDGDIFLFENKSVVWHGGMARNTEGKYVFGKVKRYLADKIAATQLGINKYAMFEVSAKGIKEELVNDNVAEIGSQCQWIAKQANISPKHINLFGVYEVEEAELLEEFVVEEAVPNTE